MRKSERQEELFRDMHLTLQPAFEAPLPEGLALYWRSNPKP